MQSTLRRVDPKPIFRNQRTGSSFMLKRRVDITKLARTLPLRTLLAEVALLNDIFGNWFYLQVDGDYETSPVYLVIGE